MQPTDEIAALVTAAQRDPVEFIALYDLYLKPVYNYLLGWSRNVADAEDLTAQTFLSAFEALPRYRHRGHFSAWLFRIARSKAIDHFRKHRREIPIDMAELSDEGPDLLSQVSLSQDSARLGMLLGSLEEGERDLLNLRYAADLSFAELASLFGKKEDTVKKTVYRLLARLQVQMEQDNG